MRCPECGYENENDNNFCNMCRAVLSPQGASMQAPIERTPINLDLLLDVEEPPAPATNSSSKAKAGPQKAPGSKPAPKPDASSELNLSGFDLNPSDNGSLLLDLGSSNDAEKAGEFDLNLDLDTNPPKEGFDLAFDINASPDGLQLDAAEPNPPFDLGIDLDKSPSDDSRQETSGIQAQNQPEAANPEELIINPSVDIPEKAHKPSASRISMPSMDDITMDFTQPPSKKEPGSAKSAAAASQMQKPAPEPPQENQEFGIESGTTEEIVFDSDSIKVESSTFEFGDLDASFSETLIDGGGGEKTSPNTDAPLEPAALEISEDGTQDESILNQFILEKPASPQTPSPTEDATQSEVDEDLAGLLMGIEGKTPIVKAPPAPKPRIAEIEEAEPEIQLEGFEPQALEPSAPEVAVAELLKEESGLSNETMLSSEEADTVDETKRILTPMEKLQELKKSLNESKDPDQRYSLVLEMKNLNIPEANSDFIILLNDELKDIKEVAAEYLGLVGCKEAVAPLIKCITAGDPSIKFIAARSLGNIKTEEAVAPLVKLLEEDNDDLRYVALEALGKIGATAAVKPVSAFLKSRNHDLRFVACEAIGNLKDQQSIGVILPMVKDPDFEVRLKAIEALGKIGSTAACDQLLVVLGEENERMRLATIQALGQIKNANAVDPLIDIFQVSNPQIKEKIIWALGEIGNERAVDPLLNLSQAFNSKLTTLALEAFAKIKSSKASRFVLSVLDKNDLTLRLKAVEALGEIAEKSTAGNLLPFLDSPESTLKINAARALGKIGNPVAIDPLVAKLTDSERDVRLQAIEALGYIKGTKAISPIIHSLREQDEQIISKAEWALCELQEMGVDSLTKALFTEPSEVIPSLVRVLGKIGSIRAIFPLLKVLETADARLKKEVADGLLEIDRHLTEENPISVILKEGYAWAQFSIAQALSQLEDDRAFSLLIKIAKETLTDKDMKKLAGIPDKRIIECSGQILQLIRLNVAGLFSKVGNDKAIPMIMEYFSQCDLQQRQWCVEAVGGIQTESALDALIEILKRSEYQIPLEMLSKQLIGNKSRKLVEKLVLSASHPSEPVRTAIATVLGETKDPRAIRTLSQLVKDTSDKVRSASIEAIGKIGTTAAVQPAIEALKDSVEVVRAKASQVLGELKDTAAVEFLEKTTHDTSESVRQLSVKALSMMADARVPDIIIKSLSDKSALVRGTAVEVLGIRKDRVALPHLIKSLGDPAETVREKCAGALANIGDTQAIMPLLGRLDDPSPLVPLACSEAIVSFKTRSYVVLIEALKHNEERIRRHACDLLIRIGDETLIQKLLKIANDRNNFLRENIARILGRIGDQKAVDPLITMLQDRTGQVRRTSAESLGMLRDIRAIVALKKTERDQSKEVRQAATAALQEIFKAHKLN